VGLVYDSRGLTWVTTVRPGLLRCYKWYQSRPSRFHRRIRVSWEEYGDVRVRGVGTYAWRVGPLRGTRYGTYAANWTYGTHMSVLCVRTWPRGNVPDLGLTDEDVGLLKGVDCDILTQALIGLIKYSYRQDISSFLKVHLQKTPELSVLGLEQFQDGWSIEKFSWVCTSKDKKCTEKTRVSLWG
jgi:hypothetical protein